MTNTQTAVRLNAARDFAWTGRHVKAIDLYTAALALPDLDVQTHLDLLDTRAESFIAIGKLGLAEQDARGQNP